MLLNIEVWVECSPQRRTLLPAVLLLLHNKHRKVGVECSPQRRTLRDTVLLLLHIKHREVSLLNSVIVYNFLSINAFVKGLSATPGHLKKLC